MLRSKSKYSNLLAKPIAFHRVYATIAGSACGGLFLSQAIYWGERTKDSDGWFYKTSAEWETETALNRTEIEKIRDHLAEIGILSTKLKGMPAKRYYKVNNDVLDQALDEVVAGTYISSRPKSSKPRKHPEFVDGQQTETVDRQQTETVDGQQTETVDRQQTELLTVNKHIYITENTIRDYKTESTKNALSQNAPIFSNQEVPINLSYSDNQTEDLGKQENFSKEQNVPPLALKNSAKEANKHICLFDDKSEMKFKVPKVAAEWDEVYMLFHNAWEAEKPSSFQKHGKAPKKAQAQIKSLVKEFREQSLTKFANSLINARESQKSYWRDKDLSMTNWMSNGKVEEYSDKHEWSMENDQAYRDRVEGKAPSMDVARTLKQPNNTSDATKPSKALNFPEWMEHQHDIVYRQDYLKSASLDEFYKKRSYLREWHEYAKANCNYEWKIG